jgi:hypothetical protein
MFVLCSTHLKVIRNTKFWLANLSKGHLAELGIEGNIILECILGK